MAALTTAIESTAATSCQSTVQLRHRNIRAGLAVVAADPLVADFDFARGGDHNRCDLVSPGQPFDLGPLVGFF